MTFRANQLRAKVKTLAGNRLDLVAHAVANEAVQLAPVDMGELYQSIRARELRVNVWRVSAHAGHALHVELGTIHTRAQPYLRPAVTRVFNTL